MEKMQENVLDVLFLYVHAILLIMSCVPMAQYFYFLLHHNRGKKSVILHIKGR